jgi:hypothetical protein
MGMEGNLSEAIAGLERSIGELTDQLVRAKEQVRE